MPMTTSDVLAALQTTGWRWESLGGELPVLTNAPVGHEFCIYCARWQPQACFRFGRCAACHNAETVSRQQRIRSDPEGARAQKRRRYEQRYRERHRAKLRAYQRAYQRRRYWAKKQAGALA